MNEIASKSEFVVLLTDIRAGSLCHELSDKLNKLVQTVLHTGKKGEITMKLKITPDGIGRVKVSDESNVKLPVADMGTTVLFATEQGQLLANDPRQMEMPFMPMPMLMRPVAEVVPAHLPVAAAS
jgi:hypothetical protein